MEAEVCHLPHLHSRHPLRIYQYVFVPKSLDRSRRHPLIVLPHGGVHGDFTTYHVHIVREMLARGYVVVAPSYRLAPKNPHPAQIEDVAPGDVVLVMGGGRSYRVGELLLDALEGR